MAFFPRLPTPSVWRHSRQSLKSGLYLALSLLVLLVSGCGSSSSGGSAGESILPPDSGDDGEIDPDYRSEPLSCEFNDMKSWVLDGMTNYYLFADQVDQNTPLDNYASLETLITDLRVLPNDTFSYITDEQSYIDRFSSGENVGLGWMLALAESNELFFKLVELDSPMANAGIVRGDRLISIDGFPALDFLREQSTFRDELLSNEDNQIGAKFTIKNALGVERTLDITKGRYDLKTVLDTRVFTHNNTQVGYLHFYQFLNTSTDELAAAFDTLASENISELVLDLRYNFGGRVSVARDLASYIAGRGKTDNTFVTYQRNEQYREFTSTLNFINQTHALELSRVFILQGADTCSASELVINGLRPFMDVITIGDTSCGKPYATLPNIACDTVMNALELESVNANGVGGYYDGIAADCAVSENMAQQLGSPSENLLAGALNYIDTSSCPPVNTLRKAQNATQPLPPALRPVWFGISPF